MSDRIAYAADKMIALSDLNGLGISTMTIETQGGDSRAFKLSIPQIRYLYSRAGAVLEKFDETNIQD